MSLEPSDAALIERSLEEPTVFSPRSSTATSTPSTATPGGGWAPGHAEEITSETFTRAFDRRASFDLSRIHARPWLFGIAADLMRRHWRTERRRLRALERLNPNDTGEGAMPSAPTPSLR